MQGKRCWLTLLLTTAVMVSALIILASIANETIIRLLCSKRCQEFWSTIDYYAAIQYMYPGGAQAAVTVARE